MKIIIPMAGKGTRLRPHTLTTPKALVELAGKPMLAHVLDRIKVLKPKEAIFVVDERNHQLESYLNKNYPFKSKFVVQKERKGAGHAIYQTKEVFGSKDKVFVIFADTLIEADLSSVKTRSDGVIWTKKVEDPSNYGIVHTEKNYVVQLIEKPEVPTSDQAIVGMYFFKDSDMLFRSLTYIIENEIVSKGEYQITDAIQYMINQGAKIRTSPVNIWQDCGTTQMLLDANKYLLKKSNIKSKPTTSVIIPPCHISDGVKIKDSIIGPNVSVGKDSVIVGSIVKNSIIGRESKLKEVNMDESIVGNSSEVIGTFKSISIGDYSKMRS